MSDNYLVCRNDNPTGVRRTGYLKVETDYGFCWSDSPLSCLNFASRVDGNDFVNAIIRLSNQLPYHATIPGLRGGDPAPIVMRYDAVNQRLVGEAA